MEANIKSYNEVHPGLGDVMAATLAQAVSAEMSTKLDDYMTDPGRLARTATKKKAPVISAEALLGSTKHERPNGDFYFTRKWGEHDDVEVLKTAREHSQYVLLYGAPGCGKTALVEAAFGNNLHTVLGSGDTEVSDLVGGYVQTPSGGFEWVDGPLLKAAIAGEPLLIDEIGLIDPKVLSIVYGLMDGRREYTVTANPERGTVKAKDGFYVVAATNPNAPGVRLSEALLSRFAVHAEMTTDWSLAKKLGAPVAIVTAAQNLAKKQQTGEVSWAPQMRELLAFRDLSKMFGSTFAIANLLAAAPELDRPVVQDVLTRVTGEEVKPAKI
jgi:nitric oxide reductase NorQ protein